MAENSHLFKFLWMAMDADLNVETPSHGGNRGSNPLGDANIRKMLISHHNFGVYPKDGGAEALRT